MIDDDVWGPYLAKLVASELRNAKHSVTNDEFLEARNRATKAKASRPTVAAICEFISDEDDAIRLFGQAFEEVKRLYNLGEKLPAFVPSRTKEGLVRLASSYKLTALTNNISLVRNLLEVERITEYFDDMVISEEVNAAKPDPEIFKIGLQRAGVKPEEAMMVGDRIDNDIKPAKELGMKTALVKPMVFSDNLSESDGKLPDFICNDLLELARIII